MVAGIRPESCLAVRRILCPVEDFPSPVFFMLVHCESPYEAWCFHDLSQVLWTFMLKEYGCIEQIVKQCYLHWTPCHCPQTAAQAVVFGHHGDPELRTGWGFGGREKPRLSRKTAQQMSFGVWEDIG